MKTCPNCQNPVNDNDMFCPNCGTRVEAQQNPDMNAGANQQYNQPNYQQPYNQPNYNQQNYNQQYYNQPNNGYYPPQQNNWGFNTTPYIVWSILNLLFCCMPLGIWSLILCVTLNKKPTYEQAEKSFKTAKTVCIVGTVVGFIVQVLYIVLMVAGGILSEIMY